MPVSPSDCEPTQNLSRLDPRKRFLLRGMLPGVILVLAFGLFIAGWRPADVVTQASRLGPTGPMMFVLVGSLMMSMLVPKTVVSLAAGALFGIALGSATLSVTAVLAAGINFSIGRWWLGDWVASRDGTRWRIAKGLADDAGFFTHLLLRLTPVPTSAISYSMGAAGARWRPFLFAAAVGSIPQWMWVWCGAATNAAMQTRGSDQASASSWVGVVISATAAITLAALLPRLAAKQIRELGLESSSPSGSQQGMNQA